ncbi:MAG: CHAT domain-containing protein, partial [Candidatus Eisenbacteria bacterium]|nr:CHAT domain-containing protein [Candidatus Eisenbacteria bacterium]
SGPLFHELNAERELIRESHPSTIGNLLVVGDPDYTRGSAPPAALAAAGSATIAGWLRAAEPCLAGSFGPLPGTGEEARNLAGMWEESGGEALVLLGAEATEARFKQEAPNRAILHIATHGYVLRDSCDQSSPGTRGVGGVGPIGGATDEKPGAIATPAVPPPPLGETQRVWLAFTGANHARDHEGDENEGLLTAEEVITLNLESTEWAVLSACHSSLAEGWYREGVRGMCEAFLFAGARSIIASRWAIEDDATRDWMTALYAARIQGETDAARAIALASRQVLSDRRNSGRSTHPFYWAAFSASGR